MSLVVEEFEIDEECHSQSYEEEPHQSHAGKRPLSAERLDVDAHPIARPRHNKEVEIDTNRDLINFKHVKCGKNMEIRLRKPQELPSGRWKQHLEIKCWSCGERFRPWKKNVYGKKKATNRIAK